MGFYASERHVRRLLLPMRLAITDMKSSVLLRHDGGSRTGQKPFSLEKYLYNCFIEVLAVRPVMLHQLDPS